MTSLAYSSKHRLHRVQESSSDITDGAPLIVWVRSEAEPEDLFDIAFAYGDGFLPSNLIDKKTEDELISHHVRAFEEEGVDKVPEVTNPFLTKKKRGRVHRLLRKKVVRHKKNLLRAKLAMKYFASEVEKDGKRVAIQKALQRAKAFDPSVTPLTNKLITSALAKFDSASAVFKSWMDAGADPETVDSLRTTAHNSGYLQFLDAKFVAFRDQFSSSDEEADGESDSECDRMEEDKQEEVFPPVDEDKEESTGESIIQGPIERERMEEDNQDVVIPPVEEDQEQDGDIPPVEEDQGQDGDGGEKDPVERERMEEVNEDVVIPPVEENQGPNRDGYEKGQDDMMGNNDPLQEISESEEEDTGPGLSLRDKLACLPVDKFDMGAQMKRFSAMAKASYVDIKIAVPRENVKVDGFKDFLRGMVDSLEEKDIDTWQQE